MHSSSVWKDKGNKESCTKYLEIATTADIDLNTKEKKGRRRPWILQVIVGDCMYVLSYVREEDSKEGKRWVKPAFPFP